MRGVEEAADLLPVMLSATDRPAQTLLELGWARQVPGIVSPNGSLRGSLGQRRATMGLLRAVTSEMLSFVREAITQGDAHATDLDVKFPFRNRFHYCVRLAILAAEIAEREGTDVDVAAVSGIFHDCGKAAGRDHAHVSADICHQYLLENRVQLHTLDPIVDCVRHHSSSIPFEKGSYPDDLAVLRDADVLDVVGAMGITWTVLAAGASGPKSYVEVLDKLKSQHPLDGTESTLAHMRTPTGRRLMLERLDREQRFIQDLTEELKIAELGDAMRAVGL